MKRKLILALLGFLLSLSGFSQKIGGIAYAILEDEDGRRYFYTAFVGCSYNSELDAENALAYEINRAARYGNSYGAVSNSRVVSQISFDLEMERESYIGTYIGSASVLVRDDSGNTRSIRVSTSCNYGSEYDRPRAKGELITRIIDSLSGSEYIVEPITFRITTC
jgi:hypothetical protein